LAIGGGLCGLVILLLSLFFGDGNFSPQDINIGNETTNQTYTPTAEEEEKAEFVSVVLKDTEDVWNALFQSEGGDYREPTLVLFTGSVDSGCGYASAATGPFYCPMDSKVYIDLSFYNELSDRFGASGDFAMAYVVAHEVGHSLGFQHNGRASSVFPVDSLRSKSFTDKYGNEASIMDYGRFNYVAQPGDNVSLIPKISVYDKFAVE